MLGTMPPLLWIPVTTILTTVLLYSTFAHQLSRPPNCIKHWNSPLNYSGDLVVFLRGSALFRTQQQIRLFSAEFSQVRTSFLFALHLSSIILAAAKLITPHFSHNWKVWVMDALKKLAEETARKRKALTDKGLKVLYACMDHLQLGGKD